MNNITNEYVIRNFWSRRQLAEALIQSVDYETTDYDWDENPIPGWVETFFITSDGMEFSILDDAISHEEWWLQQEVSDNESK